MARRASKPRIDVGIGVLAFGRKACRLSPKVAAAVDAIVSAGPEPVSREYLRRNLQRRRYRVDDAGLRRLVGQIRQQVAPVGLTLAVRPDHRGADHPSMLELVPVASIAPSEASTVQAAPSPPGRRRNR